MITRGIIIGEIVDKFSSLKYQIETRNKLGQFDLTKFCEDFFREILNVTYGYNLKNLNTFRTNEPGLDLGDINSKICFQITSQKKTEKIKNTLKKITSEQKQKYNSFNILIIGNKQKTYRISKDLSKPLSFNSSKNIIDIDSLLKEIVTLDIQKLEILFNLFKREFRQVKIELEPIDKSGNFESSYYNILEIKPSSPPLNAEKFLGLNSELYYQEEFQKLINLYKRLSNVPRVTRELLAIIVERGRAEEDLIFGENFSIIPEALERFLNISQKEMIIEINILENADLVYVDEDEIGGRSAYILYIKGEQLNNLLYWFKQEQLSIRTTLNTLDFTILDN